MENLVISRHARLRMQQRAIPAVALDLLMCFGTEHHAGGAVRLDFDQRGRRRVAHHFAPNKPPEKLLNIYAVMNGDVLVTIGHRTKRFVRN